MLAGQRDGDGTLYKPWGEAARWLPPDEVAQGEVETYFEKETHDDDSDWADLLAAIGALHADRADAAAWRAGLEATFDVASFLRALAVGQAMTSWDSYGCMHHNCYLDGNPKLGGRLQWIPWDLDESTLVREQTHVNARHEAAKAALAE
jgi:spore coat protein CotH